MNLLLCLLVIRFGASISDSRTSPRNDRLHISFTNRNADTETVVWTEGQPVPVVLKGYITRQWVEAWQALLVTKETGIYRWRPGTAKPEFVIELKGRLPADISDDIDYPICSVDSTGHKLAVIVSFGLAVIDLPSMKVTFAMTEAQIVTG